MMNQNQGDWSDDERPVSLISFFYDIFVPFVDYF
jgi:hypothetical protein